MLGSIPGEVVAVLHMEALIILFHYLNGLI